MNKPIEERILRYMQNDLTKYPAAMAFPMHLSQRKHQASSGWHLYFQTDVGDQRIGCPINNATAKPKKKY